MERRRLSCFSSWVARRMSVWSSAPLASPALHHGHVEPVESGRVFGHGVGNRIPASTSSRTALDDLLEPRVLGLFLQDVEGAEHGKARVDHRGELAGENGFVADADPLGVLQQRLEVGHAPLFLKTDDGEAFAAQLGDDCRLGVAYRFPRKEGAALFLSRIGESAHSAPAPRLLPGCETSSEFFIGRRRPGL